MDLLKSSPTAAAIGMMLASSYQRPFHRVESVGGRKSRRQIAKPNPKRALELTDAALMLLSRDDRKSSNLAYHKVVRLRAASLRETDQVDEAKREVAALRTDLQKRGVKVSIIRGIQDFEKSL